MSDASSSPAAPRDEPLHLTVHEVPLALEPAATDARTQRRGRLKMLLLFLICITPVVASYLTYYVFRPQSRHSYGELVDPQRPLPDLIVRDLDGAPVSLTSLKNQWLLITVASGACDSRCQDHLYLQRQLRESLGKDKDRLDRVWLIPDDAPVPPALLPALAQATVLRVPSDALAKWLTPAPGHALNEHFYLVDPFGNWMMRFPASLDASTASKARRDLDRLMRASVSWDEAGRPQAAQ